MTPEELRAKARAIVADEIGKTSPDVAKTQLTLDVLRSVVIFSIDGKEI